MPIKNHLNIIKNLNTNDKACISRAGIRIGAKFFFMPNLLKKFPMELNALLWKIFYNFNQNNYYPLPTDGRVSFDSEINMPDTYWSAIGYNCLNRFVIRVDVFERVFFIARQKVKYGPFLQSSDLMNPVGCNYNQLKNILNFCEFRSIQLSENQNLFYYKAKKQEITKKIKIKKNKVINLKNNKKIPTKARNNNLKSNKKEKKNDPNSPFAVLEKLL
jgi:hypothetical protein